MLKFFFIGAIVAMLSNLTGIPASLFYPIISNSRIKFESTSIDKLKFNKFKTYVESKF